MPKGVYVRKTTPPAVRFWRSVVKSDGCWNWRGATNQKGYGIFNLGPRRAPVVRAHRFAYELLVGNVPAGLELDHLCSNRACVNPEHLEAVTHHENITRGYARRRG